MALSSANGVRRVLRRLTHLQARRRGRVLAQRTGQFIVYTGERFLRDDGFRLASGLSYTSLLALVPLLAIVLAIVSAFPAFEGVRTVVLGTLTDALPAAGKEVAAWLRDFVARAEKMTGPGVIGLAVTAVLLLNNINGAFNAMWRVSEPRPWPTRLLVYWALLTLGPLFLGASLSLSSAAFGADAPGALLGSATLARVLAIALLGAGLGVIYFVVPNRAVHPGHAALGGLVAAALFEVATFVFGVYLANFPSYEAIYGAFSTLPIFLVWLFLSWCAVLLGAEVAAGLPEWRAARARGTGTHQAGARLALVLTLLSRMHTAMQHGGQRKRTDLVRDLPATPAEVDAVLTGLRERGYVARTQQGRWVLARHLDAVALADVVDAQGLGLEPGTGWPDEVAAVVRALADAGAADMHRSVRALLEGGAATKRGEGAEPAASPPRPDRAAE